MNSGFLLINKPADLPRDLSREALGNPRAAWEASAKWGPTSHDIIDELRKITGERRIGHAGTLDPFASGLLIVAVGREATRNIAQFVKHDKTYIAKLHLGATSDTFDRTGIIKTQEHKNKKTKKQIQNVLQKFIGEQMQTPPMYSAKKVGGKKLYELARQGIEIERKPVNIKIDYIKILKFEYPGLEIETRVSSGTYIRSLAHDIGQTLGCGAYLEELERTEIGNFKLKNAVETKNLTKENWQKYLFQI
ncbi:MAG: tRNA pseudouridine(55) synthase TruB [bacterium]